MRSDKIVRQPKSLSLAIVVFNLLSDYVVFAELLFFPGVNLPWSGSMFA